MEGDLEVKKDTGLGQAIFSCVFVIVWGFVGALCDPTGAIIVSVAAAMGCIVYAIRQGKEEQ